MASYEEELMALDIDYVRDLVKGNQGRYSQHDLTRKLRLHYKDNDLPDPGYKFGTHVVEDMVKNGILELKANTDSSACTLERCYVRMLEGKRE